MKSPSIMLAMLFALAAISACGGTTTTPGGTPARGTPAAGTPAPGGPAGGSANVSIVDFAFEPAQLNVSAGTTVAWVNDGQAPHTVRWSDGEPESPQLASGDEYERTFDAAGTFDYVCGIHPNMMASVTVTE